MESGRGCLPAITLTDKFYRIKRFTFPALTAQDCPLEAKKLGGVALRSNLYSKPSFTWQTAWILCGVGFFLIPFSHTWCSLERYSLSAMRYISQDSSAGVLGMDEHPLPNSNKTVRDILLEKHPEPTLPPESVLMEGEPV